MAAWNDRHNLFKQQAQNYVKRVSVDDFVHSTYCSFNNGYFYGECPKTGCSTIKKVLIQAELGKRINFERMDYIHFRAFTPFLKITQVGDLDDFFQRKDIFKFCFVRNPYTRLLSCYLDKIKRDKPENQKIKIQLGLRPDDKRTVTFKEFVEAGMEQQEMHMDQHWRTQFYQTYQSNIEYDFIGKFENFEEDFLFVLKQLNIDAQKYYDIEISHATKADENIQAYYSTEIAEKVYQKYHLDFEYFGYEKSVGVRVK